MAGFFESACGSESPVRHKVFVSYHHDNDQDAYEEFSRVFHDKYEVIHDTSLDRTIGSEEPDYVMRRIRQDYIKGSSCTIVLVGEETANRKYIDWEIKATLDREHGLIGVQLPTARANPNGRISVPARLHDNIESKFALWLSWSQLTSSTDRLERYIADAKERSKSLINNSRSVRVNNS